MDIKTLLKQQADMIQWLVKCLSDGDVDGAIDLLKSSADEVTAQIEKAENDPDPADEPKDEPTDGGETPDEGGDTPDDGADGGTDGGDTPSEEPVEKTVKLTKAEMDALAILKTVPAEQLQKWADLWIWGSDLGDILDQLSEAKDRIAKLEKTGKQTPEDATPVEKKSSLSWVLSVGE